MYLKIKKIIYSLIASIAIASLFSCSDSTSDNSALLLLTASQLNDKPFDVRAAYSDADNIIVSWHDNKSRSKYYVYYNTSPKKEGAVKLPISANQTENTNSSYSYKYKGTITIPVDIFAEKTELYFGVTGADENDKETSISGMATCIPYSSALTCSEAVKIIPLLPEGIIDINISGELSDNDIESIKSAMLKNEECLINLDLSQTTGLEELGILAFSETIENAKLIDPTNYDLVTACKHNGTSLHSIILPENITSLGPGCFENCEHLTSIIATGVKKIDFYAFFSCTSLKDFKFSDSMESIRERAFGYCNSLTEINLNAESIYFESVYCCSNLSKITLGKDVKNIYREHDYYSDEILGTFNTAENLSCIEVDSENTNFMIKDGILFNYDGSTLLCCPPALDLESIIIPKSTTYIYPSAFYNCNKIKSFTVGKNIHIQTQTWGQWAGLWSGLWSEKFLVNGMNNLSKIEVDPENTYNSVIDGILYDNKGKSLIYCPRKLEEEVIIIPEITEIIDYYAFYKCENIKAVATNNVTHIYSTAFYNCTNLNSVTMNNVTHIHANAFYNCTNLNSVTMNNVTYIGECAFYNCTNLYSFYIPASITYLGETVFGNWTKNQTINIEATSKPSNWSEDWALNCKAKINWGVTKN